MSTLASPRGRRRNRPLAAWRKARAVEGHTYDTIAREVGYANRGTAYRVVRQALDERIAESVDEARDRGRPAGRAAGRDLARGDGRGPRGRPAGHRADRDRAAQAGGAAAPGYRDRAGGWSYNEVHKQWTATPEALERLGGRG